MESSKGSAQRRKSCAVWLNLRTFTSRRERKVPFEPLRCNPHAGLWPGLFKCGGRTSRFQRGKGFFPRFRFPRRRLRFPFRFSGRGQSVFEVLKAPESCGGYGCGFLSFLFSGMRGGGPFREGRCPLNRLEMARHFGQVIRTAQNLCFEYRICGPDGASFVLLREERHTAADISRAKAFLYATEDVLSIRVETVTEENV